MRGNIQIRGLTIEQITELVISLKKRGEVVEVINPNRGTINKQKEKRLDDIMKMIHNYKLIHGEVRGEILFRRCNKRFYFMGRKTFSRDLELLEADGKIKRQVVLNRNGCKGKTTIITIPKKK